MVMDVDGSVGGTANSTVVSSANPALTTSSCTTQTAWGAYYCPGLQLVPSLLLDRLRTVDIRMGPITITRMDGQNRQYYSSGPYPDLCARRFAFPRYPYVLASGYSHSIIPGGRCDLVHQF